MESKKNEKYDLEKRRPILFGVGMIISISLAITAFEWRTAMEPVVYPMEDNEDVWYVPDEIKITEHREPVPPEPKKEIKVELKEIIEIVEIELVSKTQPEPEVELGNIDDLIEKSAPTPVTVEEAPFEVVEERPSFPGGEKELLKFLGENVKYPRLARNIGIEGRVTIQFIVEKDGSLTDITVIKGIGAGCDEEAIRVMKLVPNFSPGKQRGVPVRVRMMVPINFRLQ